MKQKNLPIQYSTEAQQQSLPNLHVVETQQIKLPDLNNRETQQINLPDLRAMEAQQNETAMNRFVADNTVFILHCASKVCKRYITESDDEYAIAMVAFWEAVRQYDPKSGFFRPFAALVMRRRLMDWFDSQSRYNREIAAGHSMTWDEESDTSGSIIAEVQKAVIRDETDDAQAVRDEIEELGDVLRGYGFSFFDLAEASPKAAKTKRCCARAVNWMLGAIDRILRMRISHSLPVAAISAALKIARKILERHRRYIIAATEILEGDYPHLAEYLDYIRKEKEV